VNQDPTRETTTRSLESRGEASGLQEAVGGADDIDMGQLGHQQGLHDHLRQTTADTTSANSRPLHHQGGESSNRFRNRRFDPKARNRRMQRDRLLQPTVHHSQEDRGLETSPQSATTEPVHDSTQVQDGNHQKHLPNVAPRGLVVKYRPKRRVSPRGNGTVQQTVPTIQMGRENISVSDLTIRIGTISVRVHQDYPPDTAMGKDERDSPQRLFGRPFGGRRDRARSKTAHSHGARTIGEVRIFDQRQEINSHTHPPDRTFRVPDRHGQDGADSPRTQDQGPSEGSGQDVERNHLPVTTTSSVHWQGDVHDSSNLSSETQDKSAAASSEQSTGGPMQLDGPDYAGRISQEGPDLVAGPPVALERAMLPATTVRCGCVHGCVGDGVGDSTRRHLDFQNMDTPGGAQAHQLEGTTGDLAPYSPSGNGRQNHSRHLRQHQHDRPNQQIRRYSLPIITEVGFSDLGEVFGNGNEVDDHVRTIAIQSSRFTITQGHESAGVGDRQVVLSEIRVAMEQAQHRPLRYSPERQSRALRLLGSGDGSLEAGRVQLQLEGPGPSVRMPPVGADTQGGGEDQDGKGESHNHHTSLAIHDLVPNHQNDDGSTTGAHPQSHGSLSTRERPTRTGQEPHVGLNSVEHRRQQALAAGADTGVMSLLFDSPEAQKRNRKRTPIQQRFISWMQDRQKDPSSTTAIDILNFITPYLEDKTWKPQTARVHTSGILLLFTEEQRNTIREDDSFKEFFKVAGRNSLKRIQHYELNLDPVFSAIRDWGPNRTMPMENLLTKTCFLLGIIGLMRPDDLACTDAAQCRLVDGRLELIVVAPKERRQRSPIIKTLILCPHSEEVLCPISTYIEYRARTSRFDNQARQPHPKFADKSVIFTPLIRALHGRAGLSSERISKYMSKLAELMPRQQGQARLKLRAAGASLALRRGVPVDDVTTLGNWSSPAIVEGYYRATRSLASDFTRTILS